MGCSSVEAVWLRLLLHRRDWWFHYFDRFSDLIMYDLWSGACVQPLVFSRNALRRITKSWTRKTLHYFQEQESFKKKIPSLSY